MITNPVTPADKPPDKQSTKRRISGRKHKDTQKTATALQYQPGAVDIAPVIIAQEQGELAQELLRIAQIKNVPIKEDADLASLVAAAGVGEEIPIEAFLVIAELFRRLYQESGTRPPPVSGAPSPYWSGKPTPDDADETTHQTDEQ